MTRNMESRSILKPVLAVATIGILAVGVVGKLGLEEAENNPLCAQPDSGTLDDILCGYGFGVPGALVEAATPTTTTTVSPTPDIQSPPSTLTSEAPATVATDPELVALPGFNGYTIPCTGENRQVIKRDTVSPSADWNGIPDSGTIGTSSSGEPIKMYVREACDTQNIETLVLISSIHGKENIGQFVSHEVLYNAALPANVRVIAVPELNKWGADNAQRKNSNGVDLNRNNDIRWDEMKDRELDPSSDFYRGPSPASEPETTAINSFLLSLGQVDLALYYHDSLAYVAPVGNTPLELANTYAAHIGFKVGSPLSTDDPESKPINVDGALDAWHNNATGSPALLIEMAEDQSDPVIQQHVGAVLVTLNHTLY